MLTKPVTDWRWCGVTAVCIGAGGTRRGCRYWGSSAVLEERERARS